MSDRPGLSIFDDPDNGNGADDATQVIPAARPETPRPAAPAGAAGGSAASAGGSASFPVVRRGGYDQAAVDRHVHTLAGEKAGLTASLNDAKSRITALEREVSQLRERASETENPTYAGLGGRASEMLRLAEEQADEVLATARAQADDVLRRATKDAEALKAAAARDAEDMRIVQLKELDEQRTRVLLTRSPLSKNVRVSRTAKPYV